MRVAKVTASLVVEATITVCPLEETHLLCTGITRTSVILLQSYQTGIPRICSTPGRRASVRSHALDHAFGGVLGDSVSFCFGQTPNFSVLSYGNWSICYFE
jgi:hypothetical protein